MDAGIPLIGAKGRPASGDNPTRVAERFAGEAPHLDPLPARPFDTSYPETRQVTYDAFIDVRGNRYGVPDTLAGQTVDAYINPTDG